MKAAEGRSGKPLEHGETSLSRSELERRAFLRGSGVAVGALATLGTLPLTNIRKAQAGAPPAPGAPVTTRKNICTHCSVGCPVIAKVSNPVWIAPEPNYDTPRIRGSHS